MDFEDFLSVIFPIVNFILTISFIKKNRLKKNSYLVILLFYGLFNLSSNFNFIYRPLYQLLILYFFYSSLRSIYRTSKFFLPKSFFIFFTFSVIASYLLNNSFSSKFANEALSNYLLTAVTSIGVILTFIQDKNIFNVLSLYLKKILLINSIIIIIIFLSFGIGFRVSFTFANSNYLAFFLGTSLIFSCYTPPKSFKDHVTVILILLAIFCTGSRSILLIAIPFYLFILIRKHPIVFLLISSISISVILSFIEEFVKIARLKDINEDASILQRYEIKDVVLRIFAEKPFFGIGYGRFIELFKGYITASADHLNTVEQIVTHNDYYRVIAELGLVGLIPFIFYIIRNLYYLLKIKFDYFPASVFLLATSYSYTHNNLNSFLFWVMITMPFIIFIRLKNERSSSKTV